MATNIANSGSSIENACKICSVAFETVICSHDIAEEHIKDKLPCEAIIDERGRFRIWSANTLADKRGVGSLEHKLREASHLANQVLVLLNNLLEVLEDMKDILDGERPCLEDDSDSASEDSESEEQSISVVVPESELVQLLSNVAQIVTCLMRLSIAVDDPAPHDQITSNSSVHRLDHEKIDVEHLRDEFPTAESFLKQRLGRAMSRWRHYLQYRADQNGNFGNESAKQMSGSALVDISSNPGALEQVLPSFECPVCMRQVRFRSALQWKEHVYRDVQAYVCTFEDCLDYDRQFGTRQEWIDHEMQAHRRRWECIEGCDEIFQSFEAFRVHFRLHQADNVSSEHLHILRGTCSRSEALDTQADCPLCALRCPSLVQLYSHLGQHQEELCLYILPARVIDHVTDFFEGDGGGVVLPPVLEDSPGDGLIPSSLGEKHSTSRTEHASEQDIIKKPVDSMASPMARPGLSKTGRRAMDTAPSGSSSESSLDDIEHYTTPHTGKGKQAGLPRETPTKGMPKLLPLGTPEPKSVWTATAMYQNPSYGELRYQTQEHPDDKWSEISGSSEESYDDNKFEGNRLNTSESSNMARALTTNKHGDDEVDDYISARTIMHDPSNQRSAGELLTSTRMANVDQDNNKGAKPILAENEVPKRSTEIYQGFQSDLEPRSKSNLPKVISTRASSTSSPQRSITLTPKVFIDQKERTGVSFGTVSRSISNSESWALYDFEMHARKCAYCHDPYEVHRNHEQLCELGHAFAQTVVSHIYIKNGEIYSTKKKDDSIVKVELPRNYVEVGSLLRAVERSLRHRSRRPFVSTDKSHHLQSRPSNTLSTRQKSVRVENERPSTKPPRPKSGEVIDWPDQVEANSGSSWTESLLGEGLSKKRGSAK